MTSVYLAYPVDNLNDNEVVEVEVWRNNIISFLTGMGVHVYSPGKAWSLAASDVAAPDVQGVNWDAMRRCSIMVAYLPDWSRSIGIPFEIERFSREFGRRVLVQRRHMSYALAGMGPTVFTFPTFDLLQSALKDECLRAGVDPLLDLRKQVKWHASKEGATAPRQGYSDDAGYDLSYCGTEEMLIYPGQVADVPAGVAVQFPTGVWSLLVGRSSTFRNRKLMVNIAIIDPGFRGELFAITHNFGEDLQVIKPGERIAQLVPLPALAPGMLLTNAPLDPSERGAQGFGSTGR